MRLLVLALLLLSGCAGMGAPAIIKTGNPVTDILVTSLVQEAASQVVRGALEAPGQSSSFDAQPRSTNRERLDTRNQIRIQAETPPALRGAQVRRLWRDPYDPSIILAECYVESATIRANLVWHEPYNTYLVFAAERSGGAPVCVRQMWRDPQNASIVYAEGPMFSAIMRVRSMWYDAYDPTLLHVAF